jgi:hypothetical protein
VKKDEAAERKKYEDPAATSVIIRDEGPSAKREEAEKAASGPKEEKPIEGCFDAECQMILSLEGQFRKVSRPFCEMVGWEASDLVDRPIDYITAWRTVDIPQHLRVVVHFGELQSLWMFVDRCGKAVLVQNAWKLLPDWSIGVVCYRLSPPTELQGLPPSHNLL